MIIAGETSGDLQAASLIKSLKSINPHIEIFGMGGKKMQAEGTEITTIEGLASGDQLHAVQEAFLACGGAQCGICTPGMVLAAVNLLEQKPKPSEAEIRVGLAGNLCRCTGYMRIFEAVIAACQRTGIRS